MRKRITIAAAAAFTVLALTEAASAYYSPAKGRFLARDPIGEHGGANLHAFVENTPVTQIDVNGLGTPEKNAVLSGLAAERNVHRGYLYYEDDVTGLKTLLWALNADVQSYGPKTFEVDAALGSTQAKWDSQGRDRMYIGSLNGLAPASVVHESVHLRNTVLGKHQGQYSYSALNDDESNATGIQHMIISLVHLRSLEGQIRKRASCTSLDRTWRTFWLTINSTVGTQWSASKRHRNDCRQGCVGY